MFKFKKTQKWHTFKKDQEPILKHGDIIRVKDSSGTFRVCTYVKVGDDTYFVQLEVIIPKTFPASKPIVLLDGDEYRIIGKSTH